MQSYVQLENIGLTFPNEQQPTLQDITIRVAPQEFVSIIGRSGCGKTSLIQMIAGLLKPTAGKLNIGGSPVNGPRQEITYIFQRPVLLEWRSLLENVLLPLELQKKLTAEDLHKATELLELVGLLEDAGKYPHECSGGMLSRAALARALLTDPQILLMDEPFAALDFITKEQLQIELEQLSSRFSPTVIFITHDIGEAVFLSDRVILLGGRPAHVAAEYSVPFGRPREKELKYRSEFLQVVKKIHDDLENLKE